MIEKKRLPELMFYMDNGLPEIMIAEEMGCTIDELQRTIPKIQNMPYYEVKKKINNLRNKHQLLEKLHAKAAHVQYKRINYFIQARVGEAVNNIRLLDPLTEIRILHQIMYGFSNKTIATFNNVIESIVEGFREVSQRQSKTYLRQVILNSMKGVTKRSVLDMDSRRLLVMCRDGLYGKEGIDDFNNIQNKVK